MNQAIIKVTEDGIGTLHLHRDGIIIELGEVNDRGLAEMQDTLALHDYKVSIENTERIEGM